MNSGIVRVSDEVEVGPEADIRVPMIGDGVAQYTSSLGHWNPVSLGRPSEGSGGKGSKDSNRGKTHSKPTFGGRKGGVG
jgi:hypothetical protein